LITALSEKDLLQRCRNGDTSAFRAIVEVYYTHLYRVAFALSLDEDDASDIVQDTLVKAWRGLRAFRGEASLKTWLTRLTLNAARDHARRQHTRQRTLMHWNDGKTGVEDASNLVSNQDELHRALMRLSLSEQRIVALRFGLDLPIKEIAQVLECPEGTAKSRLHSAMRTLRTAMKIEGSTP